MGSNTILELYIDVGLAFTHMMMMVIYNKQCYLYNNIYSININILI